MSAQPVLTNLANSPQDQLHDPTELPPPNRPDHNIRHMYSRKIDDMVVDYNTLKGLQKDNTNWPTFKTELENRLKGLARNLEREIKHCKDKIHRSENLMHIVTEQHQRALQAQIDEDNRWVNAIIRDKNMVLEWIKNLNRLP